MRTAESEELRWVPVDDVGSLPLHPALALAWPGLRRTALDVLGRHLADRATAPSATTRPAGGPGRVG